MSGSKLLVIESPNKISTLQNYLNDDFSIIATVGHIRDLPKFNLGFEDGTFIPKWVVPKDSTGKGKSKKDIIEEIQRAAGKATKIYLAPDPDREGEAIAWHVYEILDKKDKLKCERIVFNEISKQAVLDSFKNPRKIDMEWVYSQFARRLIDRMIGFRLSRLTQYRLRARSAGRVQSVVLKFIGDREKEIEKFKPQYWWTLDVILENDIPIVLKSLSDAFINDKKIKYKELEQVSGIDFLNKESAELVLKDLTNEYKVYAVDDPTYYTRKPKDSYKTSTMQQDAINKLRWSTKKVTSVAQQLYEGINVGKDHIALISYPRTDSVRMSDQFKNELTKFIVKEYGEKYLCDKNNSKVSKKNSVVRIQDAHECIRPINIWLKPSDVKDKINKNCYSLYKLIWIRTVASMMAPAKFMRSVVRFNNNGHKFYAVNRQIVFDGYRKIYSHYEDLEKDKILPMNLLSLNKILKSKEKKISEHSTQPPDRYTQASLIASLERAGIGRPSTYNTMTNIVLERGYCELKNKSYFPTALGIKVIGELENYFPNIINKDFTKSMEDNLDKIADGREKYQKYLEYFWPMFELNVKEAFQKMEKTKIELEKIGEKCPDDNGELVYRYTRKNNKKFIACLNYPKCKYTRWLEPKLDPVYLDEICPKCNEDKLMERVNKWGNKFIACSGFPKCRYIKSNEKQKND